MLQTIKTERLSNLESAEKFEQKKETKYEEIKFD